MNLQEITVSGNVGQAPEIKDVNGTKVANFSIAVNENYKNKNGEKVENTSWYRIEAWDGKNGNGLVSAVIEPMLTAGQMVYVKGTPVQEEYEKDGVKQRSFKVKLAGPQSLFKMIGGLKQDLATPSNDTSAPKKSKEQLDDDIPF